MQVPKLFPKYIITSEEKTPQTGKEKTKLFKSYKRRNNDNK